MLYDKRWSKTVAPVVLEPWRVLLLKAARILERDGWCRNTLYWRKRSCAVGALNRAAYGRPSLPPDDRVSPELNEARARLLQFIGEDGILGVEHWNDNKCYDGASVISVMRRVARA